MDLQVRDLSTQHLNRYVRLIGGRPVDHNYSVVEGVLVAQVYRANRDGSYAVDLWVRMLDVDGEPVVAEQRYESAPPPSHPSWPPTIENKVYVADQMCPDCGWGLYGKPVSGRDFDTRKVWEHHHGAPADCAGRVVGAPVQPRAAM